MSRTVLLIVALVAGTLSAAGDADAATRFRRGEVRRGPRSRVRLVPRRAGRPAPRRGQLARSRPARPPTGPGRLETHSVGGRDIQVYLPPGYDEGAAAGRDYPLLILQDAQNLFGAGAGYGSWDVDRAIDTEVQAGRVEPLIVVAVPHAGPGRIAEYTVNPDAKYGGGRGADYIQFVADRLRPWAVKKFRVRPGRRSTAIGGSSLGARISIEALLARPEVFGKVLAHSPSVWFNDAELLKRVEGGDPLPDAEIYLDSGGSGDFSSDDADNVASLRDALMARSFEHGDWDAPGRRATRRLWHWFEPAHTHSEAAWRERFPRALRALFPAP